MEDREKLVREEEGGYLLRKVTECRRGQENETYPSSLELQKSPITFSFFGSDV